MDLAILPFCSAVRLVSELRQGRVSSVWLLEYFIKRTEQFNVGLRAIAQCDYERAKQRAIEADQAQAAGKSWGPLHGLPITVKGEHDVKGLLKLTGDESTKTAEQNCPAVQRLLDAGAIIFATTNIPVHCLDWETYNPIYGATLNPWNLACSPGGSSGGSAVATAVGITPFELGGDGAGSIRIPACFCGVYGLKPTFDLIPRHILGQPKVDMVVTGPIARYIEDLELALSVLSCPLSIDADSTVQNRPQKRRRLEVPLLRLALCDFRVAFWDSDPCCAVGADVQKVLDGLAKRLTTAGAAVTRDAKPGLAGEETFETYMQLLAALRVSGEPTLQDKEIALKHEQMANEMNATFLAKYWRATVQSHGEWRVADAKRYKIKDACEHFFDRYDMLIAPISPCAAFKNQQPKGQDAYSLGRTIEIDGKTRPYADLFFWPHLAMVAALPSLAVPVELNASGLPVGVQILGPEQSDFQVLAFAKLLVKEGIVQSLGPPPQSDLL